MPPLSPRQKLVEEFLHSKLKTICPEPFLSIYLEQNMPVPFTNLKIYVPPLVPGGSYSKTITLYFHNKEYAKAKFSTQYVPNDDGTIRSIDTVEELPINKEAETG